MSGSGSVLAETLSNPTTCHAQLIPTTGGSPIWCDTTGQFNQLALSPDGTLLAASTGPGAVPYVTSATDIYKNGTLVAAVAGWAPGWIDNGHLLVNNCVSCGSGASCYTGATIYDSAGTKLSAVVPPELRSLQAVTATSVYEPCLNELVSTANGTVLWSSGDNLLGCTAAIAGSQVVFVSGSLVLTQPY